MIKQVFLSDQKYFSPQKKSNGSFIFFLFSGLKHVDNVRRHICWLQIGWNNIEVQLLSLECIYFLHI